jgi:hypothetical protein
LLGDKDVIRKTLDSLSYAITKKPWEKTVEPKRDFNLASVYSDQDLKDLAVRVVEAEALDFSLCLYGAPGTGKSTFARHLAERMGLKALHKRASDLFGMHVWVKTRRISPKRSRRPQAGGEVPDLRRGGQLPAGSEKRPAGWEVSTVSEMLMWM